MTIHSYLHVTIPLTQDGATPLYMASQKGHSDVVNILISNGADVNIAKEVMHSAVVITFIVTCYLAKHSHLRKIYHTCNIYMYVYTHHNMCMTGHISHRMVQHLCSLPVRRDTVM